MSTPFVNKPFVFKNPDGSLVHALGWGDENHAIFETVEGYTIVQDPETDFYRYAQLSPDGTELVPTDIGAEDTNKERPNVPQHLRPSTSKVRLSVRAARTAKPRDSLALTWPGKCNDE